MFKVNKLIIISFFFLISLFLVKFSYAALEKFYLLTLTYNNGSIQLKNVNVLPGIISQANQGGNYRAELISNLNKFLYKITFDVPTLTSIHGEDFDYTTGKVTSKETKLDTLDIVFNIPYSPNGKEIDVYDSENKKILTISVAHFAEVSPTPISPTPQYKVTKLEKGTSTSWVIGGGILLFAITAIGIFAYLKTKKPQNLL